MLSTKNHVACFRGCKSKTVCLEHCGKDDVREFSHKVAFRLFSSLARGLKWSESQRCEFFVAAAQNMWPDGDVAVMADLLNVSCPISAIVTSPPRHIARDLGEMCEGPEDEFEADSLGDSDDDDEDDYDEDEYSSDSQSDDSSWYDDTSEEEEFLQEHYFSGGGIMGAVGLGTMNVLDIYASHNVDSDESDESEENADEEMEWNIMRFLLGKSNLSQNADAGANQGPCVVCKSTPKHPCDNAKCEKCCRESGDPCSNHNYQGEPKTPCNKCPFDAAVAKSCDQKSKPVMKS